MLFASIHVFLTPQIFILYTWNLFDDTDKLDNKRIIVMGYAPNGTLLNASTYKVNVQTEFQLDTRENNKRIQSSRKISAGERETKFD